MKKINTLFLIFFVYFNIYPTLSAQQIIIPFDSASPNAPVNCMDTWTENGLNFQLVPIPPDTDCFFGFSGGKVDLYPARLSVDLSGLGTINSISIDVVDFCGIGCTKVMIWNDGNVIATIENSIEFDAETIVFDNPNGDPIDQVTIESFEAAAQEIRICTNGTGCSDDLILPNESLANGTYTACGNIISESQIAGTVSFIAEGEIDLNGGFEVMLGGDFLATIDPDLCNSFQLTESNNTKQITNASLRMDSGLSLKLQQNPVLNTTNLHIDMPSTNTATLSLSSFNTHTQILWKAMDTKQGHYEIPILTEHLAEGIYYLSLNTDKEVKTIKMLVMSR